MNTSLDIDLKNPQSLADYLNSLSEYKVLKQVNPNTLIFNSNSLNEPERKAIYLDCESTGLDFDKDKVIEIGMIIFSYGVNSGTIFKIENQYSAMEDPGFALSDEIIKITGITDKDLEGKKFNDDEVINLLKDVSLVIAHNASFDRNMLEKRFDCFKDIPWACTANDINWNDYDLGSIKLEFLLFKFGYFYKGHRALIDCFAGMYLLNEDFAKVSEFNENVMSVLLKKARADSYLIKAIRAPFYKKDDLRNNGYRWHPGSDFSEKFWWKEVLDTDYQKEIEWLSSDIYESDFPLNLHNISGAITKINARVRHKKYFK